MQNKTHLERKILAHRIFHKSLVCVWVCFLVVHQPKQGQFFGVICQARLEVAGNLIWSSLACLVQLKFVGKLENIIKKFSVNMKKKQPPVFACCLNVVACKWQETPLVILFRERADQKHRILRVRKMSQSFLTRNQVRVKTNLTENSHRICMRLQGCSHLIIANTLNVLDWFHAGRTAG